MCVCRSLACFLGSDAFPSSDKVVLLEVELQDGVFDGCKDEPDVLRVGGARKVGVDDLVTIWIQVHKHF